MSVPKLCFVVRLFVVGFWENQHCFKRPAQVIGSMIDMWVDVVLAVPVLSWSSSTAGPDRLRKYVVIEELTESVSFLVSFSLRTMKKTKNRLFLVSNDEQVVCSVSFSCCHDDNRIGFVRSWAPLRVEHDGAEIFSPITE